MSIRMRPHNLPPYSGAWGDSVNARLDSIESSLSRTQSEHGGDIRQLNARSDGLSLNASSVQGVSAMYRYPLPSFSRTVPAGNIGDRAMMASPTYVFNAPRNASSAIVTLNASASTVEGPVGPYGIYHLIAGSANIKIANSGDPSELSGFAISMSATTPVFEQISVRFGREAFVLNQDFTIDFDSVVVYITYYGGS